MGEAVILVDTALVGARNQTVRLVINEPPHPPREDDPTYRYFNQHRAYLKRAKLLVCKMPGPHRGGIELHHRIPYATKNGVDPAKVARVYADRDGAIVDFDKWFHTANTEPLCAAHHDLIHALGVPFWLALAVWRDDLLPPVQLAEHPQTIGVQPDVE